MTLHSSGSDREELIDSICAVLVAHDLMNASMCLCGTHLYTPRVNTVKGEGALSLRRHRAEIIIDALGLE